MLRRASITAVFALALVIFVTSAIRSFGDPGDPVEDQCEATSSAVEDFIDIDSYQYDPMTGAFFVEFSVPYSIDCEGDLDASCCIGCYEMVVYVWDTIQLKYVQCYQSGVMQTQTWACGTQLPDELDEPVLTGNWDGPDRTVDFKIIFRYRPYVCKTNENDVCCIGCDDPAWTSTGTRYLGENHD